MTQARSVLDQLHKIGSQANGALGQSIKALDQKIETILRGPMPAGAGASVEPTLTRANGAVGTLYGSVGQADAAPTAAQVNAVADTERDLSALMKRWEEIKKSDLPALNRQLKGAKLPEVRLEATAQMSGGEGDLE